jgi:RNA-directed DNA polymerase
MCFSATASFVAGVSLSALGVVTLKKLKRKRHDPIDQVGAWLTRVLRGYFNYHAVPDNLKRLAGFRLEVCRAWLKQLRRRGQKHKMTWALFGRLAEQYLPHPRQVHPYPCSVTSR